MFYRNRLLWLFLACCLVIVGCSRSEKEIVNNDEIITIQDGQQVHTSSLIPGMMRIQVTDKFSQRLESLTDEDGIITSARVKSADESIFSMGVTRMERTFPYAGEFEARTRKSGLHLWYDVYFDESQSLTKAGGTLDAVDGVVSVEYRPKIIKLFDEGVICSTPSSTSISPTATLPFDDPMLGDQWHYYNDGTKSNTVSGCDVNVVPAWKKFSTGSSAVIVAIVDGGIDYTHEDLASNMWHNPEQSGDFQYGYNFVSKGYRVLPEDHGTHVAGTVSAVNNNGLGVCGVAGGNYANGIQGALLMSCQIFEGKQSGDGAKAIKWGADHGAVIAQNSWGYEEGTSTPQSDIAAFKYFIDNAGFDANGTQVGPMAGGIVIFSAGNEDRDRGYPGADVVLDCFISVSSLSADYKRAYYSNYGEWVDIAAPGGDVKKGRTVLSTIPNNQYGKMQGTSMACPHVSGVAALVVSYLGKQGFTNTALQERLLNHSNPVIKDYNPAYALGTGLVNAYASMSVSGGSAPDKVTEYSLTPFSNNVTVSLTIPSDSDDEKPSGIIAYFDTVAFNSRSVVNAGAQSFQIPDDLQAGDVFNPVVRGLKFEKKYYMALVAFDMAGNRSELSDLKSATTLKNNAPIITPENGLTATVKAYQTVNMNFTISEPDQHSYTVDVVPGSNALKYTNIEGKVQFVITGKDDAAGTYKAVLTVTDEYGMSQSVDVTYTILVNTPPVKIKDIENIVFGGKSDPVIELNLDDYFRDDDGENLSITSELTDINVVNVNASKGKLYLTPLSYGYSDVAITATDALGKSVSSSFKVLVRDSSQEIDIYPNPVRDILKIRTSSDVNASVSITNNIGSNVFYGDISISPFAPAEVDMSTLSGGTYVVSVIIDGKNIVKNVVKL